MLEFLESPFFPLRWFVPVASVDRSTLENWMRSGALVPASGESGAKLFSILDLLKVELMARLRICGIPPLIASQMADVMVEDYRAVAVEDLTECIQGQAMEDSKYLPAYAVTQNEKGAPVLSRDKRAHDAPMIVLPVGVLGRFAWRKADAFAEFMEAEGPKLKKAAREAAERGSQ